MRGAWRDWYADETNRERHIAAVGRRRARRIARLRKLVQERKTRPCTDCKRTFPPEAMDFDHVRGDKNGEISHLVYAAGEERLLEELEKCEPVCATCHRLRTQRRREADGPPATG